jgi:hypothetical protein
MKTLIVAKVIDNPNIPLYQYSFEAPNDGWACGEQSIRATANGRDLKISECFKENHIKDNTTKVNTIASAMRNIVGEAESGLDIPKLKAFDNFRVDFKPNLKLAESIVNYAQGKVIVHVGSGQGHLVKMLKMRGGRVIGVEPNINKQVWMEWRMMNDGNLDSINEVLAGEICQHKYLLQHPLKTLIVIARPKVKDFVLETVSLMANGSELLYITLDEIDNVKTFFGDGVTVKQVKLEGFSEDNENIYSIIK